MYSTRRESGIGPNGKVLSQRSYLCVVLPTSHRSMQPLCHPSVIDKNEEGICVLAGGERTVIQG